MPARSLQPLRLAAALIFSPVALPAGTQTVQLLDLLRALAPAPNTAAIAAREGFALHGLESGAPAAPPRVGDTVTALVQFGSFDGRVRPVQWLVRLRLAAAASAATPVSDTTLHTNTGRQFTFLSRRSNLSLETLGPIRADTGPAASPAVQRRAISVATDFLRLDLYRTTQVVTRIQGSKLTLSARPAPFPAAEVNTQRPLAAALGLTAGDLRSFAGIVPALTQFLDIVRNTPDLQPILFRVLDKPSLIDVFRHHADRSIHFDIRGGGHSDGLDMFWPGTRRDDFGVLMFNLEVFAKPVLTVVLYVTTPRPPLLVSAGVLGLFAFSPSNPDQAIAVRVLSATSGAAP